MGSNPSGGTNHGEGTLEDVSGVRIQEVRRIRSSVEREAYSAEDAVVYGEEKLTWARSLREGFMRVRVPSNPVPGAAGSIPVASTKIRLHMSMADDLALNEGMKVRILLGAPKL